MTTSKKKLCILIGSHWEAVKGGSQYQVKVLVDKVIKTNEFEVFYLVRDINADFRPKGYKLIQIAKPEGIRRYGLFFDAFALTRLLEEIKPDIIYQRVLLSYTGIAAYYAKKHNCKYIFHISSDMDVLPFKPKYTSWPWNLVASLIERKIGEYGVKHADYIIAQTQCQKILLENEYGKEAAAIIPNFHPLPTETTDKKRQPFKVIWIANFKLVKRPEIFVNLAKDLVNEKDVEFIMIGRAGDSTRYKTLLDQISKQKKLMYMGECSLEKVNKMLSGAHVLVNTSIVEGLSNTFIQAWMRKVPIVCLDVNPDHVLDQNNMGFYCGSYEKMLERVIELIKNPMLRDEMGEKAQEHAYQHYSEKNIDKLIEILQE